MRSFGLGLLLGAILLALLFARVDASAVGQALSAASISPLVFALALKVVAMVLKARRWGIAIESASGVRPRTGLVAASMVGYAANLVMPARLGEVARVLVLGRHVRVARTLTLMSAGIAQFLDLLILVLLMAGLVFWGTAAGLVKPTVLVAVVSAMLLMLVALYIAQSQRDRLIPLMERIGKRLPKSAGRRIVGVFRHATDALVTLRDGRVLAIMLAYTACVWGLEALSVAAALVAFHIDVSAMTAMALMVVLNLTFVLPLTPGNLGTHQLVSVIVLGATGVAEAYALAYSLGIQGCVYLVTLSLGAVFLYREGIGFAAIRRANT